MRGQSTLKGIVVGCCFICLAWQTTAEEPAASNDVKITIFRERLDRLKLPPADRIQGAELRQSDERHADDRPRKLSDKAIAAAVETLNQCEVDLWPELLAVEEAQIRFTLENKHVMTVVLYSRHAKLPLMCSINGVRMRTPPAKWSRDHDGTLKFLEEMLTK